MRAQFFVSDKGRDLDLARAFCGCADVTITRDGMPRDGFDIHCIIGLKHLAIKERLEAAGMPYLYWDKGYRRRDWPHWWRVVYNAQQPGHYLGNLNFPDDRAAAQGWLRLPRWRSRGDHIVLGGWSGKCSAFLGIDGPTEYLTEIVARIRRVGSDRRILYRAKPSWRAAEPIPGTDFSGFGRTSVEEDLTGAHALITHSSGTCDDALAMGVPSIVLGPGTVRSISTIGFSCLEDLENPRLATEDERTKLLSNKAYHQWNLDELRSGAAVASVHTIIESCIQGCTSSTPGGSRED